MKAVRTLLLSLAVPFAIHVCVAQGRDAAGCKDSPAVARFPGALITGCNDKLNAFDFTVTVGSENKTTKIAGRFLQTNYSWPDTATKSQVIRTLNESLHNAGYTFDYDSGDNGDFTAHKGRTWVMEEVSRGFWYRQTVVVVPPPPGQAYADAATLSKGLASSGHIAVNGIFFDTGKAEVKPESAPALQEVANLLSQNPEVKLYVVGHTDNAGTLSANIDLSKRRAAAVVQALTTQYGVPALKLQAYGLGPFAPTATNDTEDGRALNRRVELVKQ
jgi:OOP family OmpA-OmpF porin